VDLVAGLGAATIFKIEGNGYARLVDILKVKIMDVWRKC
jgi:hypothetical protein